MSVIRNSALPASELPGIGHLTLAGSENGLRNLSIWKQSIAPGAATPAHRHDCEEVVLITAGRGELELEARSYAFGPDTTLIIPRNALHQIVNIGDECLALIGVFSAAPVDVFSPEGQLIDLPWSS